MISALASSRPSGSKSFTSEGVTFGWEAVTKVYEEDISRAERNLARLVPGLKYAYIERDSWTKLNVRPSKIMQVSSLIIEAITKKENRSLVYMHIEIYTCNLFCISCLQMPQSPFHY